MTKREIKVHEYTCDGCGKVVLQRHSDEIMGVSGNVVEISEYGSHGGEWYACKRACVRNAIFNVLDGHDNIESKL